MSYWDYKRHESLIDLVPVIISPNKALLDEVKHLINDLQINGFDAKPYDDYLISLIEVISGHNFDFPDIASESEVSNSTVDYIYSNEFRQVVETEYQNYWKRRLDNLIHNPEAKCIHDFQIESMADYKSSTVSELLKRVEKTVERNQKSLRRVGEAEKDYWKWKNNPELWNADFVRTQKSEFNQVQSSVKEELRSLIKSTDLLLIREQNRIREQDRKINNYNKRLNKVKTITEAYQKITSYYKDDCFLSAAEEIVTLGVQSKQFRNQFPQIIRSINMLYEDYTKYSETDFSDSMVLDKDSEYFRGFGNLTGQFLSKTEKYYSHQLKQYENLEKDLKLLEEKKANTQNLILKIQDDIKRLNKSLLTIQQEESPAWETIVTAVMEDESQKLSDLKPLYNSARDNLLMVTSQRNEIFSNNKKSFEQKHIKNLKKTEELQLKIHNLEQMLSQISELELNNLWKNLIQDGILSEEKLGLPKGKIFHFHLYLGLLLCVYYYGKENYPKESFFCIDEAQDINEAEYKLLESIWPKDRILNLYGDINQSIFRRGQRDWNYLKSLGLDYYEMDTNYRNPEPVVSFCNENTNFKMQSIGLPGKEVVSCTLEFALECFYQEWLKDRKNRVAVITAAGHSDHFDEVYDRSRNKAEKWPNFFKDCLKIYSVEQGKGLEFDCVYVSETYMSEAEKYVAYTRSVSILMRGA